MLENFSTVWRRGTADVRISRKRIIYGDLEGERYDPMVQEPDLFLRFAGLGVSALEGEGEGASNDALLQFARDYGPLGGRVQKRLNPGFGVDAGFGKGIRYWAEKLSDWRLEANNVSLALDLFRQISERDKTKKLKGSIKHMKLGVSLAGHWVCTPEHDPHYYSQLMKRKGDVISPSILLLQNIINQNSAGQLGAGFVLSDTKLNVIKLSDLKLHVAPLSLLGAIWLQLGMLVAGGRKIAQCQQCGKLFLAIRSDTRTCSDACRVAKFRSTK